MKKLVLFGDSLLAGVNNQHAEEIEKAGVDLYNCSTSGWDTEDGLRKSSYLASLKPDYVVFSFGTNDSGQMSPVSLEGFKNNLRSISDSFEDSIKVFFVAPPINEATYQDWGSHLTLDGIKSYAEATKEFAQKNNLLFIDSWKIFDSSNDNYHDDDGVHLNDLGYQILIEAITEAIES